MMISFSGQYVNTRKPFNTREVLRIPGMVAGLQTPMYLFVCIGHASSKFRYYGKRKVIQNAAQRRQWSRIRKVSRARDAECPF